MAGGVRIGSPSLVAHHKDIGLALSRLDPNLPTFVLGHSMGGLNVSTFLMNNAKLNIAGVMLSAPCLDQEESNFPRWKRRALLIIKPIFEVSLFLIKIKDLVFQGKVNITNIAKNHLYSFRRFTANKRAVPLGGAEMICSWVDAFESIPLNAKK